ncbi:MAG TPA: pectinesterase family protein [Verrucomicrobiae bacterium]|nr:pectinesterase family protein [Verrucomicrobiae bacterium]
MKITEMWKMTRTSKLIRFVAAGSLATAVLLVAVPNVSATTYNWTNNTVATAVLNDPNAWSPIGGPGGSADTFTYLQNGTFTVQLTNDFSNIGSFQFGAANSSGTLVLTLDFGTNVFAGLSGNSSSASGFVFGQGGTMTVYCSVGTMYCTNTTGNGRMMIGRQNGPITFYLTNGNVKAGNLILANGPTASGSKLVVSGANSFWTNNSTAVGNAANASNVALVVSNSATFASTNGFTVGGQSPNNFCSVLVDSNARLVTSNQTPTVGGGTTSSTNTITVQGGALWDVGLRPISIGSGGGIGNSIIAGNNGIITNVTYISISAGNSLSFSGGVVSLTGDVTNNNATISGFGALAGNVVFTGTASLSLGLGSLIGNLTVSQNVPLLSTSTTTFKIDKSQTGSNDMLTVLGTLTENGTVTINNIGPAISGGDTFQLFTAGTASGDFITTNLPALSGTLIWDTSAFHSGTLSVILPPSITGPDSQAVLPGSNVVISAVVTGVPVPSLQWQHEGTNLIGETTDTVSIPNAQTNDAGQYCLIASNTGGAITNCMDLTVCEGGCPPKINGLTDQTVIQGNNGSFSASVAGLPAPSLQWQENGTDIADATGVPLVLTNVQYSQDGYVYSLIASNEAGVAVSNATLHVIVTPAISQQPTNLTVSVGQSASFSVTASGVPAPTYQWQKNNASILNETNSTFTIPSVQGSDMANYRVVVSNAAGSINSSNAFLTVLSTVAASLTPSNGAVDVCYDTPLYITFGAPPLSSGHGSINIYNVTNPAVAIDTIDTSAGPLQSRTIGTESFFTYPVIITGNQAAIYPHLDVLSPNQTYFVTVDQGVFTDTNGALYAGVTSTNGWLFTTKSTPANPNNLVVAADGSGDFCTVQGAVDSLPTGNTNYTLVNIRDGDYNEIVDTRNKNNITFRGQSVAGTVVGYLNNNNNNGSTHSRMAFKVYSDDVVVESMTITNRSGKINTQAEALMLESNIKRFICNNAKIASYQDTILGNTGGTQAYFKDSLIVGDTDFIWGSMNAFFTNCELQCQSPQSHVTQARTDDSPSTSNGMSFVYCRITRPNMTVTNCDLGRTLGFSYGNVIFKHCLIDDHITGWSDPSLRDWEFDNSNLTATASVTYNGVQLTNGDANVICADDPICWLYGWNALAPTIVSGPTNLTVTPGQPATFTVSATSILDPLSYQWLKDGTNVVGATSATLNIASADAGDAGVYSVIVSNSAGSVTSASATLTVTLNAFQTWQQQHFGCTLCPQAAASADPDGDGLSNEAEYLAGSDPTNSASALRITSAVQQSSDVVVTWTTFGGHTNILQATAGEPDGSYSTNGFTDIPASQTIIPGSGDVTTNYTDVAGGTNSPSRYYRIRLVP